MSSALNKMTVEDFDVKGKRVLVRCDFNVKMENGVITSDKRIVASLPTNSVSYKERSQGYPLFSSRQTERTGKSRVFYEARCSSSL